MDRDDDKLTVENVDEADDKLTVENVDETDDKLTVENVDEQVEHYLLQLPASEAATPLLRAISDLHSIYAENRSLEQAWARINNHVSALNINNNIAGAGNSAMTEELPTIQPALAGKKVVPAAGGLLFQPGSHKISKRSQRPFRWNWRIVGTGLVAAILLLTIFIWPLVSYALHGSTPQSQSPVNVSSMKVYSGQYFKIQYPSDWIVTQVASGSGYQQTVQFRPSATSAVFVNINVLPNSVSSADQLLQKDPDVKLGSRIDTSSVTYHGIPWKVSIVERTSSAHTQAGKIKIAYSNQGTPYRIEFGTTADKFDTYMSVFDAMFASFYAQTSPVVRSTATTASTATPPTASTATPGAAATPTVPSVPPPTIAGTLSLNVYSSQYFKIQYPSNWVVTQVTTGGSYQQTVQLRPSATSAVTANINVLPASPLSADQLLLADPDIKLGTLLSTNVVTYHGVSWNVGIANVLDPVSNQQRKVEVAYSNQGTPYKFEFSAPAGTFDANTQTFNTILASFVPAS